MLLISKTPLSPLLAAASKASFSSSILNDFSDVKVKSKSDTFETGTLIAFSVNIRRMVLFV